MRQKNAINDPGNYDPVSFLNMVKETILNKIKENPQSKVHVNLVCTMIKSKPDADKEIRDVAHFSSKQETIHEGTDLEEVYQTMKDKILESLASYQKNGSGWRFEKINKLEFNISKSNPLKGSSYIPLPKNLNGKKAIINMENDDQQCFKWCITRALNPVERDPSRITKILRKKAEKLNFEGVNFPASFSDITRCEKNNNMSIVVLGYDTEDKMYILTTHKEKSEKTVIFLLIKDKDGNKHYCLVKSISRLLASQVSKRKRKRHFCHYCLNGFDTETLLENHKKYCSTYDCVKTEFPNEKNAILKCNNHGRMHKVPFVVYADFECFTKPLVTAQQDPNNSE